MAEGPTATMLGPSQACAFKPIIILRPDYRDKAQVFLAPVVFTERQPPR